MAPKTNTPAAPTAVLGWAETETPENINTTLGRASKYSPEEISAVTQVLEAAYQHGEWRSVRCPDADAAKRSTLLMRYVADQVGAGLGIFTKDEDPTRITFRVKDRRVRTASEDPKPRKPRETKGRAGTQEYQDAMVAYEAALEAWQSRQG